MVLKATGKGHEVKPVQIHGTLSAAIVSTLQRVDVTKGTETQRQQQAPESTQTGIVTLMGLYTEGQNRDKIKHKAEKGSQCNRAQELCRCTHKI